MAYKQRGGRNPLRKNFPSAFKSHEPGHEEEGKKIGNKPGAEMDESNSSKRMRELAALDTGVEYAADPSNKEWQRRRDLNAARLEYSKSLGNPTGDDVAAAELRRLAEEEN